MATVGGFPIDDQKRVMEQWAVYWSSHDLERLLLLFTADVVYEDVPMRVVNRGTAELRTFVEKVLSDFPDVAFELQSSFTDGSRGAAEWLMRGTRSLPGMPATGKRVEVRGVSVFEFAGDKIRRCSDYWDIATYLEQLGLTPSG